ncbi:MULTISPECIES: multidrug effflux MFS transporter [Micromonospora]|uniref:MFS transporter, DHA1 family, bicyclomycin/chloramphenicol resistance protein n=1 Tax=Micromonospora yangpuensis TaxID=683228 RepID=A0A1C6V7T3_9ACTN|nr:multidrug effflux MFS transporter [Micromonospora yangpuensis]GGM19672.1 Bcr/CflA family drug resistance efflux transporter [Micromonospora yangpuensis]SCL62207.1 MFS transporter, DHA1 family, bicyclomycin/chloramphenicol resistance protein [Micromonospora yangpuensis]
MTAAQQTDGTLGKAHPAAPARAPSLVALILLLGVGPFATDAYIAALPELQRSLPTSAAVAQLTLTAFIVGLAVGQLLLGPLSDAWGRRRMLLVGCALFAVASVVCAVAPNGPVLVAARLAQGIVAGGGVALGRATVTDTHRGDRAAATFGLITSVTFLGPVVAPAVGGLILAHGTWRTVFAALAGLGVAMFVAVFLGIAETLPAHRRQPAGLRQTGARLADLAGDWSFMRHVALVGLAVGGFFVYIGGSSFVFQSAFAVSPSRYTIIFATNAAAMAGAGLLFRMLVFRVGALRLRTVGVTASTLAALGLLAAALVDPARVPLAVPWALLCVVVGGMGFTMPATTALAQEAGRRSAGTAAALQGGLSFLVGALVTPLTGLLGYDTLLPMAASMAFFFVAASVLLWAISRPHPST